MSRTFSGYTCGDSAWTESARASSPVMADKIRRYCQPDCMIKWFLLTAVGNTRTTSYIVILCEEQLNRGCMFSGNNKQMKNGLSQWYYALSCGLKHLVFRISTHRWNGHDLDKRLAIRNVILVAWLMLDRLCVR